MTPTEKNNLDFTAIGKRIRDARKRKGLRITDAIELTGMSSGVISALEIGNRNPGLNSLVTFSKAYDVSLDELVFGRSPSASTLSTSPDPSLSPIIGESKGIEEEKEERDPYFRSLREILDGCDSAEKEFMLRLISTAHSEFGFVRNKMVAGG